MATAYAKEYDQLEKEYKALGFKSLTDYLLAKKAGTVPQKQTKIVNNKVSESVKVKCSDINSGATVGFTKEGYQIVASKRSTKGVVRISYHLHSDDSPLLAMSTRKTFPTVKMMVNEINQIIDEQKTNELAWW